MARHLYLDEGYADRPPLDLGPMPEAPVTYVTVYVCPRGCGASALTPKRCRPCKVKMKRERRLVRQW